jgi:hypothetical protein
MAAETAVVVESVHLAPSSWTDLTPLRRRRVMEVAAVVVVAPDLFTHPASL